MHSFRQCRSLRSAYPHAIDQFNVTAEGDSERMSDREHSFFLLNGINPVGADRIVVLQLIQDRIESEFLDKMKKLCLSCSRERLNSGSTNAY